jgi:hypothetical protein
LVRDRGEASVRIVYDDRTDPDLSVALTNAKL